MRGLTVEWSSHNIRLLGIAPGPIKNSGGAKKLDPLNLFKIYNNYTNPRKRWLLKMKSESWLVF